MAYLRHHEMAAPAQADALQFSMLSATAHGACPLRSDAQQRTYATNLEDIGQDRVRRMLLRVAHTNSIA